MSSTASDCRINTAQDLLKASSLPECEQVVRELLQEPVLLRLDEIKCHLYLALSVEDDTEAHQHLALAERLCTANSSHWSADKGEASMASVQGIFRDIEDQLNKPRRQTNPRHNKRQRITNSECSSPKRRKPNSPTTSTSTMSIKTGPDAVEDFEIYCDQVTKSDGQSPKLNAFNIKHDSPIIGSNTGTVSTSDKCGYTQKFPGTCASPNTRRPLAIPQQRTFHCITIDDDVDDVKWDPKEIDVAYGQKLRETHEHDSNEDHAVNHLSSFSKYCEPICFNEAIKLPQSFVSAPCKTPESPSWDPGSPDHRPTAPPRTIATPTHYPSTPRTDSSSPTAVLSSPRYVNHSADHVPSGPNYQGTSPLFCSPSSSPIFMRTTRELQNELGDKVIVHDINNIQSSSSDDVFGPTNQSISQSWFQKIRLEHPSAAFERPAGPECPVMGYGLVFKDDPTNVVGLPSSDCCFRALDGQVIATWNGLGNIKDMHGNYVR